MEKAKAEFRRKINKAHAIANVIADFAAGGMDKDMENINQDDTGDAERLVEMLDEIYKAFNLNCLK
jgi:hypothetical protein